MSRGRHATRAAGGHRTPRQMHVEAVAQYDAVLAALGEAPDPCTCSECTDRPEPRHLNRCRIDGHPMGLDCTCGHGHDRHVGGYDIVLSPTRCMSYTGRPNCTCSEFTPATYPEHLRRFVSATS